MKLVFTDDEVREMCEDTFSDDYDIFEAECDNGEICPKESLFHNGFVEYFTDIFDITVMGNCGITEIALTEKQKDIFYSIYKHYCQDAIDNCLSR